jgi:catechol 2,3-dioxygenase-like lactoylglutathione lyase family enzyme
MRPISWPPMLRSQASPGSRGSPLVLAAFASARSCFYCLGCSVGLTPSCAGRNDGRVPALFEERGSALKLTKDTVDIGVLVRDIDSCNKFYSDVLGLKKVGEVPIAGRIQHRYQLGGALLKLLEFPDGNAPPPGPKGRLSQAGIRYITVHVPDAAALAKELEAKGVPIVTPVTKTATGSTIAMFEDPEGNTIEIASA